MQGAGIAVSPQFFGNPAKVRTGSQPATRVLGREEELARELVISLSAEQKSQAIIETTVPRDIITGANKQVTVLGSL